MGPARRVNRCRQLSERRKINQAEEADKAGEANSPVPPRPGHQYLAEITPQKKRMTSEQSARR
jgi:hypothetical protein